MILVVNLKIFAPLYFDHSKFPSWEQQRGLTTLRISNAGIRDNYANIDLAFNNWKRETAKKKENWNLKLYQKQYQIKLYVKNVKQWKSKQKLNF